MTTLRYAIFDSSEIGPDLEIRQSGEVVGVTDTGLDLSRTVRGTIPVTGDVHYFEQVVWATNPSGSQDVMEAVVGVLTSGFDAANATVVGGDEFSIGYDLASGDINIDGSSVATIDVADLGDVIGVRLDLEQQTVTFFRNGIQQASIDISGSEWAAAEWMIGTSLGSQANADLQAFLNTGQRAFEYTDPLAPQGWYEAPVTIDTFYIGTHDRITAPTDEPANERIEGRIPLGNTSFTTSRRLSFWTDGSESVTDPDIASLTILDPNGDCDDLISGDVRDLPVTVYELDSEDDFDDAEVQGTYIIDRVEAVDDMRKRLVLKGTAAKLDNPIQRRLFLPSVDPSAANRPIPIALGAPLSVEPIFYEMAVRDFGDGDVDVRRYKLHDQPLLGFGFFRDRGDILDGIDTMDPVYYAAPDGQGVDLLVNPDGKLTIDISSQGGDVPMPPPNLLPASLAGWDVVADVTESGGVYTFDDTITTSSGRVESSLTMTGILAAMTTYSYTLTINSMTGFFGSSGKETKVQFIRDIGAGSVPVGVLANFTDPGTYTGSILNFAAGAQDFIIAMVGTQSGSDEAKLSVTMSLTEVSTAPVTSDNLVPISLRDFLFEVLIRRGGFSESEVNLAAAAAIDAATGYLGISWYTAEQVSVRQALEDVLPSYGVCLAQDRNGVFVPIRIVAPEDQTPDGSIGFADLMSDLRIGLYEARGLTNRFGLQRNESVLDPSDFVDDYDPVTGVDLPTRIKLGRQYREIVSTGGAFASAYSFAYSADALGTRFFRIADAQAELDRIRYIFRPGAERKVYGADVPLDQDYDLGQFKELTYPRYGLDAGKILMVVGIEEDRINERATLTLWG